MRRLKLLLWIGAMSILALEADNARAHLMVRVCNPLDYNMLTEAGRNAYTSCQSEPGAHNSISHLANTAWSECAQIFGEAACNNAKTNVERAAAGASETVQSGIACVSDPVACIERLADEAGVLDPKLSHIAILSGNISYETGGLIFSDFGITTVRLDYNATNASVACRGVVGGWYTAVGIAQQNLSIAGAYRFTVPACGPIVYTLTPENPLFTWTPANRTVTVGTSQSGNDAEVSVIPTNTSNMTRTDDASANAWNSQPTPSSQATGQESTQQQPDGSSGASTGAQRDNAAGQTNNTKNTGAGKRYQRFKK